MEERGRSGAGTCARFVLRLVLVVGVVGALFAMHGTSMHSATAGHAAINWITIESLAVNVPVNACCTVSGESDSELLIAASSMASAEGASAHPDLHDSGIIAMCAFGVILLIVLLRSPAALVAELPRYRDLFVRAKLAVLSVTEPPSLHALGISRT